jgi:hypothetical protein
MLFNIAGAAVVLCILSLEAFGEGQG